MEKFREFDPSLYKAPEETQTEQTSKLKEYLKKAVLKTAAFSVIFGGGHLAGHGQTRSVETRPRFAPTVAEKTETKKRSFTAEEVRAGLRTDQFERMFISTDGNPQDEMFEIEGQGISTRIIDYKLIQKTVAERGNVSKLKVIHTHPLGSYRNIFNGAGIAKKELQDYRAGRKDLPPHPPSVADFQAQNIFQNEYRSKKIDVRGEVIDGSGTWNYTVSESSELMKQLMASRAEALVVRENLSDEEKAILNKIEEEGQVDLRTVDVYLQSLSDREDPTGIKRKMGEKLTRQFTAMEKKYSDAFDKYYKIESAGAEIMLAQTPQGIEAAMEKYVTLCEQNGIHVTYTPVKK